MREFEQRAILVVDFYVAPANLKVIERTCDVLFNASLVHGSSTVASCTHRGRSATLAGLTTAARGERVSHFKIEIWESAPEGGE